MSTNTPDVGRLLRFQLRTLQDEERTLEGQVVIARGKLGLLERKLVEKQKDIHVTQKALAEIEPKEPR